MPFLWEGFNKYSHTIWVDEHDENKNEKGLALSKPAITKTKKKKLSVKNSMCFYSPRDMVDYPWSVVNHNFIFNLKETSVL